VRDGYAVPETRMNVNMPSVNGLVATQKRVVGVMLGVLVILVGVVLLFAWWSNWNPMTTATALGGGAMGAATFVAGLTLVKQSSDAEKHDAIERVVAATRELVSGEVAQARDNLTTWARLNCKKKNECGQWLPHDGLPLVASPEEQTDSDTLRTVLRLLRTLSWVATLKDDVAMTVGEQSRVLVAHVNSIIRVLEVVGGTLSEPERRALSVLSTNDAAWDTAVTEIAAFSSRVQSVMRLPKLRGTGALPLPTPRDDAAGC